MKWVSALRRRDFTPSKYAYVCSAHFVEEDFDRTSKCVVRLRPCAIPSVFPAFPKYLQMQPKPRPPPKARSTTSEISSDHSVMDVYGPWSISARVRC